MSSGTDLMVSVDDQVSLVVPVVSLVLEKVKIPVPLLGRIPRKKIEPLPLSARFSKKTQADYLKVFNGLNVLFIGDASIRTLYRDLCKMIRFGRLLETSEAARQNGNYPCLDGQCS